MRKILLPVLLICGVLLGLVAPHGYIPAVATSTPKVSIAASATAAPSGPNIKLTVTVKNAADKQRLAIERRFTSKGKWTAIRGLTVSKSKTVSQSLRPRLGPNYFRASLARRGGARPATSKVIRVTGTILVSPRAPLTKQKASLSGYLPTSFKRPVQLQQRRGNKWVRVASNKSTVTGYVTFKYAVSVKTAFRIVAPAARYKGKPRTVFASPGVLVTPRITQNTDTDTDRDSLPDFIEQRLGSSAASGDTDRDGLRDEDEVLASLDPTTKDSDGNGLTDPADDLDSDGLTNKAEIADGTLVYKADTDDDGLSDKKEKDLRTKPTRADTDTDGVTDGVEVEVGYNPLSADSDGDGTVDRAETYQAEIQGPEGSTLQATGTPDAVTTAEVTTVTDVGLTSVAGSLGAAVEVTSDAGLQSGTLEIPFDTSSLASDARVGVLHFDEKTGTFDLPADQTVDLAAGKVTVTTDEFSPFVVVDLNEFEKIWKSELVEPREGNGGTATSVDAMLALDSSGSMLSNDPSDTRKTAAKLFVDALVTGDLAGALDFDDGVRQLQPLTSDFAAVKALIDSVDSSGGTDIGSAVEGALNELDTNGVDAHARIVVLLTDGDGSYDDALTTRAADSKTVVYTVGLGSGVNETLLQGLANATGGKYFQVANADQLPGAYERIIGDIGAPDTDKDGLADAAELAGWRTQRGNVYKTDPNKPDSDSDGLTDGEEAGRLIQGQYGKAYDATSNPLAVDSDGDRLDDGDEFALGLDALTRDTDGDKLEDLTEVDFGSDPTRNNPDGDLYLDQEEYQKGLDPLGYDLNTDERIAAAIGGFVFGDSTRWAKSAGRLNDAQIQSVDYILGQVASGVIVIGDIRDVIVNIGDRNFWGTLLSGAAFIPVIGDGAKLTADFAQFAKRGAAAEKSAYRAIESLPVSAANKKSLNKRVFGSSVKTFPKALEGGPADTFVYYGIRDGNRVYAGITRDLARRQTQHGDRFTLQQITASPVSRGRARAIEEALIVRNVPPFRNKIHSISQKHPYYAEALAWGEDWLKTNGF